MGALCWPQVLNCIDYLHKFGYSKKQVGAARHD
jgi:hypothetical protein